MLIKPDIARFAKIKVVGVGGGGSNAVTSMVVNNQIKGVDFLILNCDAQALLNCPVPTKIQIGEQVTRGLGAGGNPEIGRQSAEESREKIKEHLIDADMVFITAGMGGGTGTGAAPIVAEIAKELGALTIAVVTKPFNFEGTRRRVTAEEGVQNLKDKVDTLIVIPNQRLLETIDMKMTLLDAFHVADSVLERGVSGISDLITTPGLINVDFADVKNIMSGAGSALMGIGTGAGENRAAMAARAAISSHLLEVSIDGAKGVLFNITGGPDLTMAEVDEAARIIAENVDADANIIFGATIKQDLVEQVKISVIAVGFDQYRQQLIQMQAHLSQIKKAATGQQMQPQPQQPIQNQPLSSNGDFGARPNDDLPPEKDEWDVPAFLRRGN